MTNKRWIRSVATKDLRNWKLEGGDQNVVDRELARRNKRRKKREARSDSPSTKLSTGIEFAGASYVR